MNKILLVEDEKDVSSYVIDLLESKGYKIACVSTGKEAIEILKDDIFDVAIIDLLLPDMNGNDLCAIIRHDNRFRDLPIIVSTGIGDEFTRKMSEELGVNEFLRKPYDSKDLVVAIKKCLGGTK